MATYGTVVAVDIAPDGDVRAVLEGLGSWDAAWRLDAPSGWTRLTLTTGEIDRVEQVRALLATAGKGCAALAEDHDEYGALWAVLAARPGAIRTVHRRYVLNAHPKRPWQVARALADHGTDPRADDVAGATAAREAAEMFGVEAGPVVAAEARADELHRNLGVVGGPFPWWDALGLVWPGPAAGTPVER
jgi:hypothetical protein